MLTARAASIIIIGIIGLISININSADDGFAANEE